MNPRFLLLLAAAAGILFTVLWPPWRLRIRQKGDDRQLAWRHAPLWAERNFSAAEMAHDASSRLGFSVDPGDVEPYLDTHRCYLQLSGALALGGLGWLLLGETRRARSAPPAF